jgi:hypothetical protein
MEFLKAPRPAIWHLKKDSVGVAGEATLEHFKDSQWLIVDTSTTVIHSVTPLIQLTASSSWRQQVTDNNLH